MNTKKYIRNCENKKCKKEFSTNIKNQKYGSEKCRDAAYKSRKWEKEKNQREMILCPSCGKEFIPFPKHKKYCDECVDKIRKKQSKDWINNHLEQYKQRVSVYTNKFSTKLKKKKDYLKINNKTKEESILEGVYKTEYTFEEDQFLLEYWDKLTKKEIAFALNRTYASIYSRYKKLHK